MMNQSGGAYKSILSSDYRGGLIKKTAFSHEVDNVSAYQDKGRIGCLNCITALYCCKNNPVRELNAG
jgi:hypothetical protein